MMDLIDQATKNKKGESMAENEAKDVVGESKSDKFKRLASKRVVNAIQKIDKTVFKL